ncbi:hypothetical protein IV203_013310 [Nitzschia inconspicua]|uniref:Uncharacterized protein n=1 Tax=Nitzschia inconspicua TaxID=303405 RepID=A0A9K3Q8P9_9STRA|nr:hypothetical protein IV203_013310 [Nitzschia inconspicua]
MYGLPQASRISNDYLRPFLEPAGYHPTEHTPGLWRQRTRALASSLVVDDFAVKLGWYTLLQPYALDYQARTCDISMPGRQLSPARRHVKRIQEIVGVFLFTPEPSIRPCSPLSAPFPPNGPNTSYTLTAIIKFPNYAA